ncbi:uncharacterized protein RCO7_15083 [Rhynchosporium graminicola]|uniref:Uncharacterized protein n=2 Tax=Rhynchosporium TaxID=38037 RepID=A0A1E1MNZ5_RHYSE|nr:uncharacterized protein RCO7_15083 [Rhynchosporium commune]CZT50771.1 uncharacterized protein RSE6_11818 [Rhynchosporium secalis]
MDLVTNSDDLHVHSDGAHGKSTSPLKPSMNKSNPVTETNQDFLPNYALFSMTRERNLRITHAPSSISRAIDFAYGEQTGEWAS